MRMLPVFHEVDRLRVGDAVAVAAAEQAEVVHAFREGSAENRRLPCRIGRGAQRAGTAAAACFRDGAPRLEGAEVLGNRLPGEAHEVGLGIKQIDVARPAGHKQKDALFAFGAKLRRPWARADRPQALSLSKPKALSPSKGPPRGGPVARAAK